MEVGDDWSGVWRGTSVDVTKLWAMLFGGVRSEIPGRVVGRGCLVGLVCLSGGERTLEKQARHHPPAFTTSTAYLISRLLPSTMTL